MKNPDSTNQSADSIITVKCRNFKNYLEREFSIINFGDFICASTFSLEKFEEALKEAKKIEKPFSFRIYYGCDENGKNHTLYIAFLDKDGRVIFVEKLLEEPLEQEDRCPPGDPCSNDQFVRDLTK